MQNHMGNACFSDFTIKLNGGAYEVYTAPNMRGLENWSQFVLQLASSREAFGTST